MYVLYDIGGTKTRIATSRDLDTFSEPTVIETPRNYEEGLRTLVETIREQCGGEPVDASAGGIAASPDRAKETLAGGGPSISDWLGKPLKKDLEEALGAPASIENDTAMGGLAQVMYGPARGHEIAVYITVSTNVGGCRFVDGWIDKSALGFEPGWQIIGAPELCGDTKSNWLSGHCTPGYLQSHIGGACIEAEEGRKPYEIPDAAFWTAKAKLLSYGLHNITTMWSPDIIVLGGSMMNDIGISIEETRTFLAESLSAVFPGRVPKLAPAQYGDLMGLYGAMAYLASK